MGIHPYTLLLVPNDGNTIPKRVARIPRLLEIFFPVLTPRPKPHYAVEGVGRFLVEGTAKRQVGLGLTSDLLMLHTIMYRHATSAKTDPSVKFSVG